jgi:hypothetical protein
MIDWATRRGLLRAAGGLALAAGNARAQTAPAPAASPLALTMVSYLGPHGNVAETAPSFAAKARELSGGELTIDVEFQMGLSRPLGILSKNTPLSYFLSIQAREADPIFVLSSLPGLVASFDEARTLLEIARPAYVAALARFDLVLLAADPWRPPALWSVKPIASAGDLKGMAFDLMGMAYNARWNLVLERAGAKYSPFGAEMMLTWPHDKNVALFEPRFSFYTETFLAVQLNFLAVGRTFFSTLSGAQRDWLVEAGGFVETAAWQERREQLVREQKEIAGWGCTVSPEPPRGLVAALRAAGEPDVAQWEEQTGAAGRELLAYYRRAVPR